MGFRTCVSNSRRELRFDMQSILHTLEYVTIILELFSLSFNENSLQSQKLNRGSKRENLGLVHGSIRVGRNEFYHEFLIINK